MNLQGFIEKDKLIYGIGIGKIRYFNTIETSKVHGSGFDGAAENRFCNFFNIKNK